MAQVVVQGVAGQVAREAALEQVFRIVEGLNQRREARAGIARLENLKISSTASRTRSASSTSIRFVTSFWLSRMFMRRPSPVIFACRPIFVTSRRRCNHSATF